MPLILMGAFAGVLNAQLPNPSNASSTPSSPNVPTNGQVVRDPTTGKLYYQQLVNVSVPAVRWENKAVTTTVPQAQWTGQVVSQSQVVFQPQTAMALRPYWIGRWNPFRQPTLAYEYRPVTTWQPTTVSVPRVVTTQRVVPQQQTIVVPQLVTETQTVQQLVQTEIPQTPSDATNPTAIAAAPQPRLAYAMAYKPPMQIAGRPLPTHQTWNNSLSASSQPMIPATVSSPAIASNPISEGLRPVARAFQSVLPPVAYQAPLQTASRANGLRDSMQTGMQATVMR